MEPEELQVFIKRVIDFEIDPGEKALSFAHRLARENRWSLAYAERVILEYKRFCVLAMVAGHSVTPSEDVDQAWHLHLTYTHSYWKRFCEETLGKPLHHGPTAGGDSETAKFKDWYAKTLQSYRSIFDQNAPADIWPSVDDRFSKASNWRWVNDQDAFIVEKGTLTASLTIAFIVFLTAAALLFKEQAWKTFPFNLDDATFLLFYPLFGSLLIFAIASRKAAVTSKEAEVAPEDLHLSENQVAMLSGGPSRVLELGVFRLLRREHVAPIKGWFSIKLEAKGNRPSNSGLEQDLYDAIQQKTPSRRLGEIARPYTRQLEQSLWSLGLLGKKGITTFTWIVIAIFASLFVIRLHQALENDQPFFFLVLEFIVLVIFALIVNVNKMPSNVRRFLHEKRKQELARAAMKVDDRPNPNWERSIAFIGMAAIRNRPEFAAILPIFATLPGSSSYSSGSSGTGCGGTGWGGDGGNGDGGNGDGGGCGGGGCGGGGCGGGCGG